MSSDRVEALIREIAVTHGIAVSRNDPIMILQTINMRLLDDSAKAQEAMLDAYKQELEGLNQQWGNNAKAMADRVLTASLSASKEAMATLMHQGARELTKGVKSEVEAGIAASIATPVREGRRIAIFNVIAAVMTFCAAGIALWASR